MSRALLVIDVQNDYFPGGALPLWQAQETESRIVAALGKAGANGDRIVLVRHVCAAATGLFVADGPGVIIRPAMLAVAGEASVVAKHLADAFQETDLLAHLAGVDELLMCGMMAQNCVVFTALSRAAEGLRVRVVGDLCSAPSEIVQKIALNGLGSKLEVVIAEDVWG